MTPPAPAGPLPRGRGRAQQRLHRGLTALGDGSGPGRTPGGQCPGEQPFFPNAVPRVLVPTTHPALISQM